MLHTYTHIHTFDGDEPWQDGATLLFAIGRDNGKLTDFPLGMVERHDGEGTVCVCVWICVNESANESE